jgi:glycosyltransferase involved in cell wall biosynthesis
MVICQNEEANIAHSLGSLAWCDEIVVVDGGSRDHTVEIAQRFTDRVIRHAWPGHRQQKQFALEQARGPWVMNIDSDERVTTELVDEIREHLPGVPADVDGFAMPRLVTYLGRWWYRGGWYPRRVLRLIRQERAWWGGIDPHERAEVRGRVVKLDAPLLHYSYPDVAGHVRSANRLTDVAAAQAEMQRRRMGPMRLAWSPAWRFLRCYVLRSAWLEGLPGLFVAATDAFYVFLRWAKVREHQIASLDGERDAP